MTNLEMIRGMDAEELALLLSDHQVDAMVITVKRPEAKEILEKNEEAIRINLAQFLVKWLNEEVSE